MGLNKVAAEIRFNAEREAQRIVSEGRNEGERMLEETKKRLKEYEQAVRNDMEAALEQAGIRSQTITQKRMKESVMNAKKEVVEKVYLKLLEHLKGMKERERGTVFRKMMAGARKQMEKPGTVYVRREDSALARKIFKGLEVKTREMEGGFMMESGDGREMVDYRFETLVELLNGRTLKGVSRTLFGEQKKG